VCKLLQIIIGQKNKNCQISKGFLAGTFQSQTSWAPIFTSSFSRKYPTEANGSRLFRTWTAATVVSISRSIVECSLVYKRHKEEAKLRIFIQSGLRVKNTNNKRFNISKLLKNHPIITQASPDCIARPLVVQTALVKEGICNCI
jgi:hypothetical protein